MRVNPSDLTMAHMTRGESATALQKASMRYGIDLAKIVEAAIPGIEVTSTRRGLAEQQRLYDLYKAGKGNVAAKPGTSWHHYLSDKPGTCKGAIDFKHKSMSPKEVQERAVEALKAKGFKFNKTIREKTCCHFQWLYGGGGSGNKNVIV